MIDQKTYTLEWIEQVSKKNQKADKILVEKVIRALTLLTELKMAKLDFIFKGGTALMLMFGKSSRLSIDIDIIVAPDNTNLKNVLQQIVQNSNFIRYEEQKRNAQSGIEKAHYKFFYKPTHQTFNKEEYILLDVLFEQNPYNQLSETVIDSEFIKLNTEPLTVKTPDFNNILGDKLTAFAPTTTGVPYFKGKHSMSMEIIKQLFDVGNIFDAFTKISSTAQVFTQMAEIELKYRSQLNRKVGDVLNDIFLTALCISLRGKIEGCWFDELQKGIQRLKPYIITGTYQIEKAILSASKAAYLSALIRHKQNHFKRYGEASELINLKISNNSYSKLNKLKKTNPEAFFYWYNSLLLRDEIN